MPKRLEISNLNSNGVEAAVQTYQPGQSANCLDDEGGVGVVHGCDVMQFYTHEGKLVLDAFYGAGLF